MVNDIRLYIDKELVEFEKTPEIYYNWTETDFTNPVITKNGYSKTIKVSGTKNNNKIFGHFWNLERYQLYEGNNHYTGTDFNPSYKVPFSLYVDGNLFEKGYVKLQKVTNKNGVFEYEIGLFGGLGSFLYNLSVNEEDGSIKTFNSLNFYVDNEIQDFSFVINKETVHEAWNLINNPRSKWHTINFAPAYTGIPDKFDADKVIINFYDMPTSTIPSAVTEDDITYLPQNREFALGELSTSLDTWQVKDLRSYQQIPVIRVKSIFDALQRQENSRGKFDNGYELVLDPEFFNDNNPYYEDAFIALPKITTLSFTDESGITYTITASTSTTTTVQSQYGLTENTTVTFELPEVINKGGVKAKLTYYLYDTVTNSEATPTRQTLDLQPSFVGPELKWYSEHRTGLGTQLLAYSENDVVLAGSDINWYTSTAYDNIYFSCGDAINYGTYVPVFSANTINRKNGYFRFVESSATDSIYEFNAPILCEVDLPTGTSKVCFNLQRCPEKCEEDGLMVGNKLFPYGFHDTPETTCYGVFNSDLSSGTTEVFSWNTGENNFFSNRYVKQSELLSTDYSVSDWLMSYCKMFGLYIHKDVVEDKIYIDTRNTYYKKDEFEDISSLIDYSKDFNINPIYASNKFYTLTQSLESSKYSEAYKNNNGEVYGVKLINTGYEFDANRKELLTNFKLKTGIPVNRQDIYNYRPLNGENPYVYNGFTYKLYQDGDVDLEKSYDVEVPKKQISVLYKNYCFDEDFPFYDSSYRMCFENEGKELNPANTFLFYNGKIDVEACGYYLTDDLEIMSKLNNNPCWLMTNDEYTGGEGSLHVGYLVDEMPVFSTYYTARPEGGDIMFSSNFGSPRELYVRQGELNNDDNATLYHQFYEKYYGDLYDVNTKVIDCYVKPKYILNEDSLRKFYWFDNSIWRLNKITDYSPVENRTVKCQFVKIQDINNISNEIPSKRGILRVTLSKYIVDPEGETITGNVFTSDMGRWTYDGSNIEGVVVTPSSYNEGCDITVEIPAYSGYSGDSRVIELYFSSEDNSTTVTLTQAPIEFMEVIPDSSEIEAMDTIIYYTVDCNPGCTVTLTTASGDVINTETFDAGYYSGLTFEVSANTDVEPVYYYLNGESDSETLSATSYEIMQKGMIYDFIWTDTSASTTSIIVDSASTNSSKTFATNMSGLTFETSGIVTGYSIENMTVTAGYPENPIISAQTGWLVVKHSGNTVGVFTVNQDAKSYFAWRENTFNVGSAVTSLDAYYDTNHDQLSFIYDGLVTGVTNNFGYAKVNFTGNPNTSGRTGTVTAKHGDEVLGTISITQAARWYFIWTENSATTISSEVNSGDTYVQKSCATNIVGTLTVGYDGSMVTGGSINAQYTSVQGSFYINTQESQRTGSTSVYFEGSEIAKITVTQKAASYYFRWDATSSDTYNTTAESADTSFRATFKTNFPIVTFSGEPGITNIEYSTTAVTAYFSQNTSSDTRELRVYPMYNNRPIGLLKIMQNATSFFKWVDTQTTATTATVGSADTQSVKAFSSNFNNLSVIYSGCVTSASISNGNVTANFTANPNTSGRTGGVIVKNGSTVVGTFAVTQNAKAYFYWNETSTDTVNVEVGSASTYFYRYFSTNYDSLTETHTGIVTGVSLSMDSKSAAPVYPANDSTSAKTGTVYIKKGSTTVGTINITQKAKAYFKWVDTQTSATTGNVASGASASVAKQCETNIVNFSFTVDNTVVTGASINASHTYVSSIVSKNQYMYGRTGTTDVYNADTNTKVGTMKVNQASASYNFKWNASQQSAYRPTVGSGDTSLTAYYTTDYPSVRFSGEAGITNIEQTAGSGITAYFTQNASADSRTMRVNAYYDTIQIGFIEITQTALGPFFKWTETNTSAMTVTVGSAVTSTVKAYTTNIPITTEKSGLVTGVTLSNGYVSAGYLANPNNSGRTGTVTIKYGSTTVGTLSITQNAKRYFYWTENNTTAITASVGSAITNTQKSCATNIASITFSYTGCVTGGSINAQYNSITGSYGANPADSQRTGVLNVKEGNEIVGTMSITQAARQYFFLWNDSQSSTASKTVGSGATSMTAAYTNDYPNLTFSGEGGITSITKNGTTSITAYFTTNPSADTRLMRVNAYSNGNQIGFYQLTQTALGPFFYWNDTNTTATTASVSSGATSSAKAYSTNIPGLTTSYSGCVTASTIAGGSVTASFTANPNTSNRTGGVMVKSGTTVVGTFAISQGAKRYFYWTETGTDTISSTANSGDTYITKGCSTNVSTLTIAYTGMVTGGSANAQQTTVTANFGANPNPSQRTGTLTVKDGSTVVGTMNLTQNAKQQFFIWTDSQSSTASKTVGSGVTSMTAGYSTDFSNVTFSGESGINSITKASTSITAYFSTNTSADSRTMRVNAYSNGNQIGFYQIIQSGVGYSFKWNDTQTTATTATAGSADTQSVKAFTTNYSGLTVSYSGCVTGATIVGGNVTAKFTANPNTSDRYGGVMVKNGTATVGTFGVTQKAKSTTTTRTIIINGGTEWPVSFFTRKVLQGVDVNFEITANIGTGYIEGYGDAMEQTTIGVSMDGTITITTNETSSFSVTLYLTVSSGGPTVTAVPYTNPYGFRSGTIGGGTGSYQTSGSIQISAGAAGSTQNYYLEEVEWEIND